MSGMATGWGVNRAATLAERPARSIPVVWLARPGARLKCKKTDRIADPSYHSLKLQVLPRYRGLHVISSSDIGICSVRHNRKSNYLLPVRAFRGCSSVGASTSSPAVVPCSLENTIVQDCRGDFNSWVVVDKVINEGNETGQIKLIPLLGSVQQICEMDPHLKDLQPCLCSQLRLPSFCKQCQVHLSLPARSEPLGQPLWGETSAAGGTVTQSQKATSATAAAEAIALAKAAVKAARDAAALAEVQTLEEADNFEDFPFEADLLSPKSAGHGELYTLGSTNTLGDFQEPGMVLTRDSSSKLDGFTSEASVQSYSTTSMHIGPTQDKIIAKSKRQLERKSKRDRALQKAKEVAAAIASSPVPSKTKKLIVAGYDPADRLQSFLRESANTELLSATEEIELSRRIQDLLKLEKVKAGLQTQLGREPTLHEWAIAIGTDPKSLKSRLHSGWKCRDKMIKYNLRLVVFVAKTYQGQGMSFQDLLQEGSMGLIKGVENFDSQKGCKFSTYAYWKIRQALTRAVVKHSRAIRLPVWKFLANCCNLSMAHIYELMSRIKEAKRSYHVLGRHPRDEEVAKLVGITVRKLKLIQKSTRAPKSIDQLAGRNQERTIGEITADPHVESPELTITKQLLRQDMDRLLRILTPRERKIIRMRYGLDDGIMKTLDEIGKVFKVSRERVRQIECRALRKLKQPHRNKILRGYLDVLN